MSPACLQSKKSELRALLRSRVRCISQAARKKKSRLISVKVTASQPFRKAKKVLAYMSLPDEVDTRPIIRSALKEGKEVYLPRIEKGRLGCYRVKSMGDRLRKNQFGIQEPVSGRAVRHTAGGMDLILVPGLGFSRTGKRLGRGGGYYDRMLSRLRRPICMGLAFREQIRRAIPSGPHDRVMNLVLTDE